MNQYEITFHYPGRTETHVRKIWGFFAHDAEEWLREALWIPEDPATSIVIEKTELVI